MVFLERKEVHRVIDHFIFLESENVSICLVVDITNYTSLGDLIGFLLTRSIHGEVFPLPDRAFHVLVIRVRFHNMFADFILLRRSSKLSETLRTAMQTQPIRATAPKARTRKEIFAVETSTGAADKYFRIGPTGGQPNQAGRSLPLSPAERRRPRAGPGGIVAGAASSGGPKAVRKDRRSARRDSRWSTGSRLWPGPLG